ncbi:ribonuclease P protein component [Nitriliruptoria bacterium AS10]|nr:ribonuclease P protein component [Salsipaludibacter albus]
MPSSRPDGVSAPAPTSGSTTPVVRPARLGSSRDVSHVLAHGTRRGGRQLSLHVGTQTGHTGLRVAVVASRRVGNAVARNRAKRLLREASRRVDWPSGVDAVLVARPGIAGADLQRVLDELTDLVERIPA